MNTSLEAEAYRQTLTELRAYVDQLNIQAMPDGTVTILPGTESLGRPVGAKLPIYSQTGTGEGDFERTLFNLRSLAGFVPPVKR